MPPVDPPSPAPEDEMPRGFSSFGKGKPPESSSYGQTSAYGQSGYVQGFGQHEPEPIEEQRARLQQRTGRQEPSNIDDDDLGEHDWTVTYTDMVTLLMAFFVILTSIAMAKPESDPGITREPAQVQVGPSSPFDGRGITLAEGGTPANRDPIVSRYDDPEALASTTDPSPSGDAFSARVNPIKNALDEEQEEIVIKQPVKPAPPPAPSENKSALAKQLENMVKQNDLAGQVEVISAANTVTLRISDKILFSSGKANLEIGGQALVARLSPILAGSGGEISIEGHTDNIPISTLQYPSNWELSAARAAMVLRQLASLGLPESKMRAIAYADTKPVNPNDTPEHKAGNRRVELVITSSKAP